MTGAKTESSVPQKAVASGLACCTRVETHRSLANKLPETLGLQWRVARQLPSPAV